MRAGEPWSRPGARTAASLSDTVAAEASNRASPLPLAHGELAESDARELLALKDQIEAQSGFLCSGYKERCFRRRLGVRMRARAVHRYAEYATVLEEDPGEVDRLLSAIMINVSKFFRNAEVWEVLRERVVPELFSWTLPRVRIWSAGSAAGEEAYSMAILLREHAEQIGALDRLRRFEVLGSDIDAEVLEAAREAEYSEVAFGETPDECRTRWFHPGFPSRLRDEVRRMVRFEPLDLLTQELPQDRHVIFCRNVTIYLEREVQDALLHRLRDSLVPGGFLILGKVESLFGSLSRAFEPVSNRERVYRKR